jgi:hypothetical protein
MPNNEPARWIGLIVALVIGAVTTANGQGFVSDAIRGQVTDIVNAAAQLVTLLLPIITAEIIRTQVSPAS